MTNHVPSNYTSMEVLRLAQDENPNPSPVLQELFKRCQRELSVSPPVGTPNNPGTHISRAK